MPVPTNNLTARLFDHFTSRTPLRTGSLIVTLFGDAIAPRGGVVWIGSLIELLAPLGISQRLVRTAVFRLVQDGILSNEQVGRRSFYSLTGAGRLQFNDATEQIYSQRENQWQGRWCIALLHALPTKQRAVVRQELGWLGFGQFGADIMAHPTPDRIRLRRCLEHLGVSPHTVLLDATLAEGDSEPAMRHLVANAWDLEALEAAYTFFVALIEPILDALQAGVHLGAADAFYIRTFMIHEYRKVVLRDPALPEDLLPDNWQGHVAYQLSRRLYRKLVLPSERFIDTALQDQSGALPPLSDSFAARFGGLRDILDGANA
jgi:phenylacetic acid degradation operon negative regulatory protein